MILQPQVDFPIVRQIANHLDTDTYYVQAIVRDADGTTLDTVNLTDQGSQRFQKRYRVPVDRSGQGAYISIVTSVYTDSGYTTKSSNYGDEENTYLIFDRVMPAMRGGGSSVDAGTIRRILAEELDKREKEEEEIVFPEMPKVPEYSGQLNTITSLLEETKKAITKIPTDKTDLTPVLFGIQNLATAIAEKEVTPETDLQPVINTIEDLSSSLNVTVQSLRAFHEDTKMELTDTVAKTVESSMKDAKYVNEIVVQPNRQAPAEKPKKQLNLKQLAT